MTRNQEISANSDRNTKEVSPLSRLLHSAMSAHSLSLRGLGRLCNINPSTLSRIINGKQTPSIRHMKLLSEHLNIPFEHLLSASGITINIRDNKNKSADLMLDMVCEILRSYEIELDQVTAEIEKELKKYERFAVTLEAQHTIRSEFPGKLKGLNGEGLIINYLERLYKLFCLEDTKEPVRAAAGSALLYLILTPDVIPDYAFPVGYLDDALVVIMVIRRLSDEFGVLLP